MRLHLQPGRHGGGRDSAPVERPSIGDPQARPRQTMSRQTRRLHSDRTRLDHRPAGVEELDQNRHGDAGVIVQRRDWRHRLITAPPGRRRPIRRPGSDHQRARRR
ncbi:MAG TPA: hypothetical protein DIV82_01915, partial [Brevundimonas diminuta]|nr:hypothetical protein [Brevundimonas diminuta]